MRRKPFNSLYVHVPFCREKCKYCDFFSGNFPWFISPFRKAVLKEFSLREPEFSQFPTVYFGGGTPSLMPVEFFESILSKVGQFSEITVEFNPEDAQEEKLRELLHTGVNRISLGIQSFSERVLKTLGRRQLPVENLRALETVCAIFSNVSVDLIYGAPGQSVDDFLKDIETAISFPVKHVSIYALTVYEETPLFQEVVSGKFRMPEEEEVLRQYTEAVSLLKSRGFVHYEISNFSLPGFECKHNLTYWKLENYLGLGPSAASFQENRYWRNVNDMEEYLRRVERGELPTAEEEVYGEKELTGLKLMMGLRLTEGVNLKELKIDELFREKLKSSEALKNLLEEGFISYEKGRLRIGEKGLFVSNTVIARLINELF